MKRLAIATFALAAGACVITSCAEEKQEITLWEVHELLKSKGFVDLTHAFTPGIPHWPGFPARVFAILP